MYSIIWDSNVPAVLAELIANAWDADASRVDVSVKEEGEGKRIIIQDNGCGMNMMQICVRNF